MPAHDRLKADHYAAQATSGSCPTIANQQREVGSLAPIDLEFRLLGPLEFLRGGVPIPVGQGRERSLLALLLLHANRVISSDGLVDRLWGEDPPTSAAHA